MAEFYVIILTATPPGLPPERHQVAAFTKVDGREALLRAADLFVGRDGVNGITVVVDAAHADEVKRRHGSHFAFTGIRLATAADDWYAQIAAGLSKMPETATHVIVHDGARCAVVSADIDQLLAEAQSADAVVLTAALGTELLEVDGQGGAVGVRSTGAFTQLLSPQVFSRAAAETLTKTKTLPFGRSLRLLASSPLNVRVSGPADEKRAKAMLAILPRVIKKGDGPFAEAQW